MLSIDQKDNENTVSNYKWILHLFCNDFEKKKTPNKQEINFDCLFQIVASYQRCGCF